MKRKIKPKSLTYFIEMADYPYGKWLKSQTTNIDKNLPSYITKFYEQNVFTRHTVENVYTQQINFNLYKVSLIVNGKIHNELVRIVGVQFFDPVKCYS